MKPLLLEAHASRRTESNAEIQALALAQRLAVKTGENADTMENAFADFPGTSDAAVDVLIKRAK